MGRIGTHSNSVRGSIKTLTCRSDSRGTVTRLAAGKMGANYKRGCAKVLVTVMFSFCFAVLRSNAQGSIGEFISIDCGSSSSYTDSLGISWANDLAYISIGQNAVVKTGSANLGSDKAQNNQKLSTIRYFPEVRKKYCYVIPEALDNTVYLIRVMFLGADFTSSQNTSFRVTINNAYWTEITISDSYTPIIEEVTYTTVSGRLSLCLVRGVGTPFISSLELRALPSWYYQGSVNSLGFTTVFRLNCGTPPTSASVRYPDDPYDRLWAPDPPSFHFSSFSNVSAPIYNVSSTDTFDPPIKALQSAWTAPLTGSLEIVCPTPSGKFFFIAFLYFAEIASVPKNSVRMVNAYVDDSALQSQPTVVTSSLSTTFNFTATLGVTTNITVSPAAGSTLGPILNAVELYSVSLFNDSYSTWQPDVGALAAIQQGFNLTDWTGDPCLPVPWDWVECSPQNAKTILRIQQINLSYYNISGTIPVEITLLTELRDLSLDHNYLGGDISNLGFPKLLEKVQLQNNNFQGSIPKSLGDLPNLALLNVDNNNLTGDIPPALLTKILQQNSLTFSASGNPYLCFGGNNTCSSSPPSLLPNSTESDTKSTKSSSTGAIVGGATGGVVGLFLLAGVLLFYCKRGQSTLKTDGDFGPPGPTPLFVQKEHSRQARQFSLMEVKAMTNDFAKVIGKGGFGTVYYGKLPDGEEVAVKVNKGNTLNGQGTAEFVNEVSLLSRVHHRNLVSLVGYCDELDQQILISVYMSEGTLQQHLYGETQIGLQLDWKTRLDIALNSARGLEYLHNSCSPPIIHRDVKSSNILLTHRLLAKVADFGISKITTEDARTKGITTMIKGTHGYLDPEYFMELRLTTKSDVYSFGIVLLELITGKRPNTLSFPGSTAATLKEWVRDSVRDGNIHAIIDSQLGGSYNLESVRITVELALLSLDQQGVNRPDMQAIIKGLTNALELELEYINTSITDHSPSNLSPGDFDQYQRVHHAPRESNDSVATYSWGSHNNMSGR